MALDLREGIRDGMTAAEQHKVRENRLRRMAARQGLRLSKSPRRDHRALDYGKYALLDARTGKSVTTGDGTPYTLSLDAAERRLTS